MKQWSTYSIIYLMNKTKACLLNQIFDKWKKDLFAKQVIYWVKDIFFKTNKILFNRKLN